MFFSDVSKDFGEEIAARLLEIWKVHTFQVLLLK
jgi:hypothetical protein